ncbi:hypothetical protein P7L66_13190 [Tistrella mobilis]|uniref:hypothetical protein n=1 Tax=Tistrella mobilis TaxID=171437 RepID=UPI00355848E3
MTEHDMVIGNVADRLGMNVRHIWLAMEAGLEWVVADHDHENMRYENRLTKIVHITNPITVAHIRIDPAGHARIEYAQWFERGEVSHDLLDEAERVLDALGVDGRAVVVADFRPRGTSSLWHPMTPAAIIRLGYGDRVIVRGHLYGYTSLTLSEKPLRGPEGYTITTEQGVDLIVTPAGLRDQAGSISRGDIVGYQFAEPAPVRFSTRDHKWDYPRL